MPRPLLFSPEAARTADELWRGCRQATAREAFVSPVQEQLK